METAKEKKVFDHIFSIIIIGDQAVGKSSLIKSFHNPQIDLKGIAPTLSVDFLLKEHKIDDKNIKIQLWDTPG